MVGIIHNFYSIDPQEDETIWFDAVNLKDGMNVTVSPAILVPDRNVYLVNEALSKEVSSKQVYATEMTEPSDYVFMDKMAEELLEREKIMFVCDWTLEESTLMSFRTDGSNRLMGLSNNTRIFTRLVHHIAEVNGMEIFYAVLKQSTYEIIKDRELIDTIPFLEDAWTKYLRLS